MKIDFNNNGELVPTLNTTEQKLLENARALCLKIAKVDGDELPARALAVALNKHCGANIDLEEKEA